MHWRSLRPAERLISRKAWLAAGQVLRTITIGRAVGPAVALSHRSIPGVWKSRANRQRPTVLDLLPRMGSGYGRDVRLEEREGLFRVVLRGEGRGRGQGHATRGETGGKGEDKWQVVAIQPSRRESAWKSCRGPCSLFPLPSSLASLASFNNWHGKLSEALELGPWAAPA